MKRKILASVATSLTAILFYSSCAKIDSTDIGNGLIPAVDNVNTFDTTLDVTTDNLQFVDSTRMLYTELHAVGIIENDIEFGKTDAQLYTSFVPSAIHSYPFVKKDTVLIDSVVLSLAFGGLYGDSNSIQQFEVREINTHYNFKDTAHYINLPSLPVESPLLGTASVNFTLLNDSVFYRDKKDTVRSLSELRIPLDTSWARHFVSYDTTNAYNNDSAFKQTFRGLEVRATEASPLKNALAYFKLSDNAHTRITFYCRVQNNGRTDTITPYFIYSSRDPEANLVQRTPANEYLANTTNGVENDEKLFIQSTPGSYATIKVPGLSTFPNSVIHRAELIMERSPSAEEGFYTPPKSLFIEALSTTGDSVFTIRNDFVLSNTNPGFDQNLIGGTFTNDKYIFNLSRYVQSVITKGYPNYSLRVSSPFTVHPIYVTTNNVPTVSIPIVINSLLAGGRVVLFGGGYADATKRTRLHIIYSKIRD